MARAISCGSSSREPRRRHAVLREEFPLTVLVTRRLGGMQGIPLAVQPLRDGRRDDRRIVIHAYDGVDRIAACEHVRVIGGALRMLEVEGEEAGGVRGFECAGALRGHGQIHADAAGGCDERRRSIRRGRQQ